MFYVTLYFAICYGIGGAIIRLVNPVLKRRANGLLIGSALKITLLFLPFVPYGVIAAQTAIHQKTMRTEVRNALISMGEIGDDVVVLRVLKINSSRAAVYITQPCDMPQENMKGHRASILYFKHTTIGWHFDTYDVPWSDCGSADGNTFPPYLEAKEF